MITIDKSQLPEPLSGNNPKTWTYYSIVVRLSEIITRILQENDYSEEIREKLLVLQREIQNGEIRYLTDEPSNQIWNAYITPFIGRNWLEIPWFFAELYFYRRVLEAVEYFNQHSLFFHKDPYAYQKMLGVEDGTQKLENLFQSIKEQSEPGSSLEEVLKLNLWGNKADLSLWPTDKDSEKIVTLESLINFDEFLLIDHTNQIKDYISVTKPKQIDFLIDNTGFELICDLLFVDFIFENKLAENIVFHLKEYPVFVSDALVKDVLFLISSLSSSRNSAIMSLGERLDNYYKNGYLQFRDESFWISPLLFWDMPADLRASFKQSELIISKGDANYRRINGDLHWRPDQKFEDIYEPFVPFLILRVIKSDAIIGISQEKYEKLKIDDPEWMKNGNWGLIQFVNWNQKNP